MEYLWQQDLQKPAFASLHNDSSTDVLIIGGGMAGVLCAYTLKQAGVDCMLVEAGQIGSGATRGTTAVLTAQHDILYQDIIRKYGVACARQYLQANLRAVEQFRALAEKIDCDYETKPSIMYDLHDKTRMQNEAAVLQKLGFAAEFIRSVPLPFRVAGAVKYQNMAQFQPLKLLYALADDLPVFEQTMVKKLHGTIAETENGSTIRAKRVIVATHFPFINRRGLYFAKQFQRRSYVIAYENTPNLGCSIEDGGENGFFMRNYGKLLLIGGGDHRTGQSGGGYQAVESFARKHFPNAKERMRWPNQDCVTLDGMPYIGPYSPNMPHVYTATGFGLWGMTTSFAAADILCALVRGEKHPYAAAFAPDRSILHKQLFKNLGTTLATFVQPTTKRCTHLGCALRWNAQEHSWDCPCHGSRFSKDGALLDNPAKKGL